MWTVHPLQTESVTTEEDGYLSKESNSSQRIAQAYIDTTQTISVLNAAYIDDLTLQDTRKLFENMPNVCQGSQDQSNRIWVRGSEVDSIYVDGVIG